MRGIEEKLREGGMSQSEARAKGEMFARCAEVVKEVKAAIFVPGRIEVLGKHTDYAGGRSLLCAVERGFCVTATSRRDDAVNVMDAVSGEYIKTSLATADPTGETEWSKYVHTVVGRMAE